MCVWLRCVSLHQPNWLKINDGSGFVRYRRSGIFAEIFVACKICITAFLPLRAACVLFYAVNRDSISFLWSVPPNEVVIFGDEISSEGSEHKVCHFWAMRAAHFLFFPLFHSYLSPQQLSFNFLPVCFLFQLTAILTWITLARLRCWRSGETRVCLTNSRTSRRVVCVTFKWDEHPVVTHLSCSIFVPANFISDGAHSTRQTPPTTDGIFHLHAAQIIFLYSLLVRWVWNISSYNWGSPDPWVEPVPADTLGDCGSRWFRRAALQQSDGAKLRLVTGQVRKTKRLHGVSHLSP